MTDILEVENILMVARNWGEDDTGCDVLLVHPKWRALVESLDIAVLFLRTLQPPLVSQ